MHKKAAYPIGRLAPTPSSGLHVGNIFACLVAWLISKRNGGTALLRIEDLDKDRSKPEYEKAIIKDLHLLGITWDNANVMHQSSRYAAYEAALNFLVDEGLVYPCFCSRADLHAASAPHRGERYVYAGTCAKLSDEEAAARFQERGRAALRLRVTEQIIRVNDHLQGEVSFNLKNDCGDFIIRRSDEVFAYQLAVVVDDLHQGVTQVVRGVDLLDSTPIQLYLRRLLDPSAPDPAYYHLPLLVDEQGRRLSKRDRDQSLEGLLEHFDSVEHFLGYLGYITGLVRTPKAIDIHELLESFDLEPLKHRSQITWKLP